MASLAPLKMIVNNNEKICEGQIKPKIFFPGYLLNCQGKWEGISEIWILLKDC